MGKRTRGERERERKQRGATRRFQARRRAGTISARTPRFVNVTG